MSDFWSKALGPSQPQPPQQGAPPHNNGAWWAPPQPQVQQPPPQQPLQQQQQYAVDNYRPETDQLAAQIQQQGFIARGPKWTQLQAQDRCPECESAQYAQISGAGGSGQYGGQISIGGKDGNPAQSFVLKRCFACGYSSQRGLSDSQVANRPRATGGGETAATRQTPEGGARLKNFGVIQ